MRRLILAFVLLSFLPSVYAASVPTVTFIPSQFSAGSPFIAIAQANDSTSTRIGWVVPFLQAYYGSFPKDGNRYICYFSNTDPAANCGPTPFTVSTTGVDPYTMLLEATDAQGNVANATLLVQTGGISLLSEITIVDTTVAMLVKPAGLPSSITYQVYDSTDLSSLGPALQLSRDPFTGYFTGNVSLEPGEYFIAFVAQASGDFGGGLSKVTIPGATGVCSGTGSVGTYQLQADGVSLSGILINQNQHYEQTGTGGKPFTIINTGGTISGLRAVVPANLSSFLSISLDKDVISSNDTVFFTVKLDNLASSVTINTFVDLVSGGKTVGQIPVRIPVTVIGGGSPTSTCTSGGSFSLQPQVWSGEFSLKSQKKSFTVTNNKDTSLSGWDYSVTGSLKSITTATLPTSVSGKGAGTIELTLNPSTSGTYDGTVTIESSDGSENILVHATFFDDISADVADLKDQFEILKGGLSSEQLSSLSDPVNTVETSISDAEVATETGDLAGAQQAFAKAQVAMSALTAVASVSPSDGGEGGDILMPLLFIIVIVAGGAGAYLFLKKKKKGTEDLEEELDEL